MASHGAGYQFQNVIAGQMERDEAVQRGRRGARSGPRDRSAPTDWPDPRPAAPSDWYDAAGAHAAPLGLAQMPRGKMDAPRRAYATPQISAHTPVSFPPHGVAPSASATAQMQMDAISDPYQSAPCCLRLTARSWIVIEIMINRIAWLTSCPCVEWMLASQPDEAQRQNSNPQKNPNSTYPQVPPQLPPQGVCGGMQHGYPPDGYPPDGYPPHGYPPHGYPPHGYPPHGYPPHGYPTHGYSGGEHGMLPEGMMREGMMREGSIGMDEEQGMHGTHRVGIEPQYSEEQLNQSFGGGGSELDSGHMAKVGVRHLGRDTWPEQTRAPPFSHLRDLPAADILSPRAHKRPQVPI